VARVRRTIPVHTCPDCGKRYRSLRVHKEGQMRSCEGNQNEARVAALAESLRAQGKERVGTSWYILEKSGIPLETHPIAARGVNTYNGKWAPTWAVILASLTDISTGSREALIRAVAGEEDFQATLVATYRLGGSQAVRGLLLMRPTRFARMRKD
jgi:hypothetical protein